MEEGGGGEAGGGEGGEGGGGYLDRELRGTERWEN